jgi:nicotinate-nucleotide pyrophosphorylase (carboxylating)
MSAEVLSAAAVRTLVAQALAEDVPHRDVTTDALFDRPIPAIGRVVAEEPGGLIVAGLAVALQVFAHVDAALACQPGCADGEWVSSGSILLTITGDGRSILKGERVALNFLQHLSGIATLTARFCDAVKGTRASILDTRKTTPGLRVVEKWAVRLGGGRNHRYGLSDGVLIKDNHLALAGGDVAGACRLARERAPHGLKVMVETGSLQEVRAALEGKADIILLDNMDPAMIRQAVELIKGRAIIEASGGVTLENVREIAAAGPDLISIGALTHSAPAVDISLDLSRQ